MRQVLNISLPRDMLKTVEGEVRSGRYASRSEFVRHLLRLWNTHGLVETLKKDRVKFDRGHGKILHSLKDLR